MTAQRTAQPTAADTFNAARETALEDARDIHWAHVGTQTLAAVDPR